MAGSLIRDHFGLATKLAPACASDQAIASFQSQHSSLFPNKQMLTLKIREVRQKLMNVTQVRPSPPAEPVLERHTGTACHHVVFPCS